MCTFNYKQRKKRFLSYTRYHTTMPPKPAKPAGRSKVQPVLEPLSTDRFYAGVKRKTGPKRKALSERQQSPPKRVENPYRTYTVSYKLRVLSYWNTRSIRISPTKLRKPTRAEVVERFNIAKSNLSRWKKEEAEGKFKELAKGQCRGSGGGRKRKWEELERELYDQFRMRRASGRIVRRGWFRRISNEIFKKVYPTEQLTSFPFSNGWFRSFLSWHHISLRFVTNKASQLPADFADAILNWVRFNRRNSQPHPEDSQELDNLPTLIGRYQLSNISNMDQTPLAFEYLEGRTYNTIGEKTIWAQSSQSGWDKRQGTIQLTVFADGIPRVKPVIFFRGQGIGPTVVKEMENYDPQVVVKFNAKAYANAENLLEYLEDQFIPVLNSQPSLLVLDLFAAHKTPEVLDTFLANDIIVSLIPGGCTSLVQPLDVSINRPFKDILKVILTLLILRVFLSCIVIPINFFPPQIRFLGYARQISTCLHQQKRILRLIRRRCVLTQEQDILRPVRPVRPDLRRNIPYVLTQRRNVSYVLAQLRVLPTSRLPQILPLIAASS